MIRETSIDQAINRLLRHFGSTLVARPPACTAELAAIEAKCGSLPRDLVFLWTACDGFVLNIDAPLGERTFWSAPSVLAALNDPLGPPPPALVPVRGEADGPRDWVVLEAGPIHGAIIRWEPDVRGAALLASGFGCYFEGWAEFLIARYGRDGRPVRPRVEQTAETFGATHVAPQDPGLAALMAAPELRELFRELDLQASAGEDFE